MRFCFVQNLQAYFCQCFLGRFLSRRIRISICWYYCNMISPNAFPIGVLGRSQTAQKIRNTFKETANSRVKRKERHWRLGASSRSTNPLSDVQHEFHHHVWVPYTNAMFDYPRNCLLYGGWPSQLKHMHKSNWGSIPLSNGRNKHGNMFETFPPFKHPLMFVCFFVFPHFDFNDATMVYFYFFVGFIVWLVVSTHLKNMLINWIISSGFGVKIKDMLKTQHLAGLYTVHPWKLTWNPKSWRFGSDDFPFLFGSFSGSMLIFQGVMCMLFSSWWFQPIWKIWVKMGIFPK